MDIRKFFNPPAATKSSTTPPPNKDIRTFFNSSASSKDTVTPHSKQDNEKHKTGDAIKDKSEKAKASTSKTPNKRNSPRKVNQTPESKNVSPHKKNSLINDNESLVDTVVIDEDSDDDIINDSQDSKVHNKKLNGRQSSTANKSKSTLKKTESLAISKTKGNKPEAQEKVDSFKKKSEKSQGKEEVNKSEEKVDATKKKSEKSQSKEEVNKFNERKSLKRQAKSEDSDEVIEIESIKSSGSSITKTPTAKSSKSSGGDKKSKANKTPVVKKAEEEKPLRTSPRKKFSASKIETKKSHKRKQISSDDEDDKESVKIINDNSDDNEEVLTIRRKTRSRSKSAKKSSRLLDSDSDEESPIASEKPKAKRKKKDRKLFIDDSDGEKIVTALDKFFVHQSKTDVKTDDKSKEKVASGSAMKPMSVVDFFGTAAVSRSDKSMAASKRKHEEIEKIVDVDILLDEELHDDEDFMKTLDQLDGPDVKKVKHSESEKKETKDEMKPVSLAGKLGVKMKQDQCSSPTDGVLEAKDRKDKQPHVGSPVKQKINAETLGDQTNKPSKDAKVSSDTETADKMTPRKVTPEKKTPSKPSSQKKTPQKTPASAKKETPSEKNDGFGTRKLASFQAYKQRAGPQQLGSKEIPEGADNCLEGLTFVITGVLDSIERDDVKVLIEKHGGKVTGNVSGKTSYLVVGREPGDSKIAKADKMKVKQLDEDALFDLIKTLPGKVSKYEIQAKEQLRKEALAKIALEKPTSFKSFTPQKEAKQKTTKDSSAKVFTQIKNSSDSCAQDILSPAGTSDSISQSQMSLLSSPAPAAALESLLWVDKHKPTSLKSIIGQQGEKSNANKLLHWLTHWHTNIIVKGLKSSGNFFGKGDGAGSRAALLSGPPGIGKTTTATLVCKEAKFSFVELNASDCRSKRSLKEVVAESLNNQTLVDYMGVQQGSSAPSGQSHCIIMDEVDGMAGNEDRGGLQELVQLIKSTKIPIICICNDRNSMKMRTLSNYCLDLRFQRPRVEQIKGAMMSLAFKEGLKISPSALNEIIAASNHDIRQIIHNMSMWSASDKNLTYDQVKLDAAKAQKDIKLGPFDVCRKVFVNDEETRKMTFNDKSDLFFHDYSFGPLFVHENYPNVIPMSAGNHQGKHLSCLSRTIDSICDGDLVDMLVRREGNWNLLPTQAVFASVIPGEVMRGSFPQMTAFPQWLGKFSSTNKTNRILQELATHMRLATSCDKRALNMDYLPALRICMTLPLVARGADGVPDVIKLMDDYDIIKEDFDNIMEVTKWSDSADPMSRLDSKTKAAFTRQYNKEAHLTPYATSTVTKKKRGRGAGEDELDLGVEGEEADAAAESEEEEDESLEADTMIKAKKATSRGQNSTKNQASSQQKKGQGASSQQKKSSNKARGKNKK